MLKPHIGLVFEEMCSHIEPAEPLVFLIRIPTVRLDGGTDGAVFFEVDGGALIQVRPKDAACFVLNVETGK